MSVVVQDPVVPRVHTCHFYLVPLARSQLLLCLAVARVDSLDMFLLLAAFTTRDLLYVGEDFLE